MKLTALLLVLFITSVASYSQGITLLYKGGGSGGWNDVTNWIQINAPIGQTPLQRVPTEADDVIFSKAMSGLASAFFQFEMGESLEVGGTGTTGFRCKSMQVRTMGIGFQNQHSGTSIDIHTDNGGQVRIDSGGNISRGLLTLHGGSSKLYDLEITDSHYGDLFTHATWSSVTIKPNGRAKFVNSSIEAWAISSHPTGGDVYAENCSFMTPRFVLGENAKASILNCTITTGNNFISLTFGIGRGAAFTSSNVELIAFNDLTFYTSGSILNGNIRTQVPQGGLRLSQADPEHPLPNIINGNLKIFGTSLDLRGGLKLSGDLINFAHELDIYPDSSHVYINGKHIFKVGGIANYGNNITTKSCNGPGCNFKLEFFGDKNSKVVWPVGMPVDTLVINKTACAKVTFQNSLYVSGETRILGGQLVLMPNDTIPYKFVSAGDVNIREGGGLFLQKDFNDVVANIAIDGGIYDLNTVVDSTCTGLSNPYNGTVTFYRGTSSIERHTITMTSGASIGNVNLVGEAGTVYNLAGNLAVNNLIFTNPGKLLLGDHNLVINGTVSNFGPTSYFVTNGTGKLQLNNIGNTATVFPVGPSVTSYNPVSLTNGGTPDAFLVSVQPQVLSSGNTGYIHTSAVVDRTWNIEEAAPGGSNATVTLQWNEDDELTGFTRNAAFLSHHTGSAWDKGSLLAATGANPYSLTRSGITFFSPFAVAGEGSTLPVSLLSFQGRFRNNAIELEWTTVMAENAKQFVVERRGEGFPFTSLATVPVRATGRETYGFTDRNYLPASNTYRLKMEDRDGSITYSNVITVKASTINSITAYPNPVKDALLIMLQPGFSKYTISVYDAKGILIKAIQVSAGEPSTTIRTADFPVGFYTAVIEGDHQKQTVQFLKQ